jgi:nucleotide-binding universal stress UspA family protein
MRPIRTILAATAFDARSRAVVPRAAALAQATGARLIVANAVLPPKPFRRRPTRDPQAVLQKLVQDLPGLNVETRLLDAPAAVTIAELARQERADLVVLGLHRRRRLMDTLRLTTMEQITLDVPCPVLIAHTLPVQPYRRVLGAVTFAPASARALGIAAQIAPQADFHAIHALQLALAEKLPGADIDITPSMTEAELLREAFLRFDHVPDQMKRPEIVPGGVHEVLQFRMDELSPDLLVIGSHSGRDPGSLGNYARDLMRAPPADLLIAKPI